jgi:hypothetical protein
MSDCQCVLNHNPNVIYTQRHHIVPESWVRAGGRAVDPATVDLCGTAHDSVHELLNEYVRNNGPPSWEARRRFNPYIRELAERAWSNRPTGTRPPLTAPRGVSSDA